MFQGERSSRRRDVQLVGLTPIPHSAEQVGKEIFHFVDTIMLQRIVAARLQRRKSGIHVGQVDGDARCNIGLAKIVAQVSGEQTLRRRSGAGGMTTSRMRAHWRAQCQRPDRCLERHRVKSAGSRPLLHGHNAKHLEHAGIGGFSQLRRRPPPPKYKRFWRSFLPARCGHGRHRAVRRPRK